jgi:choline dehydrogenase
MDVSSVVVGAGSAGCLVASRLADAGHEVVLVEAGPDLRGREPPELRDGWALYPGHGWGYTSEPGVGGAVSEVKGLRLVGGTGWLTRFAVRNHPFDYDRWARVIGAEWSYAEVREAFNAIEHDLDYGTDDWHGEHGPIPVTRYPDVAVTEFDSAVRQGLAECGFEWVPDLNHAGAVGYGRMPMNSIAGRRVTTADLLSEPRPNLTLRADCPAESVVFEGQRAVGVRLADGSTVRAATVVLSAGVYGSPCLLMRSGIGPADLLAELGIPVRAELPGVGANLCDHPAVSLDVGYRGVQRPGPVLHTLATFASPDAAPGECPDLALWSSDPEGEPAEGWLDVVLLRPEGRGQVRIGTTDPVQPPRIWLPRLTEHDVAVLCHGVRRALDVLAASVLEPTRTDPPPAALIDSDRLAHWVQDNAYSLPHTVGTCAMGASPRDGAVVDAGGRVHGLTGLYVVDASILPGPPTGFPHLVTLMMANRITDALLNPPAARPDNRDHHRGGQKPGKARHQRSAPE